MIVSPQTTNGKRRSSTMRSKIRVRREGRTPGFRAPKLSVTAKSAGSWSRQRAVSKVAAARDAAILGGWNQVRREGAGAAAGWLSCQTFFAAVWLLPAQTGRRYASPSVWTAACVPDGLPELWATRCWHVRRLIPPSTQSTEARLVWRRSQAGPIVATHRPSSCCVLRGLGALTCRFPAVPPLWTLHNSLAGARAFREPRGVVDLHLRVC